MISSKKLDGFPYNRIYYSFLKGIPTIMYIFANQGEWKSGSYFAPKIVQGITNLLGKKQLATVE